MNDESVDTGRERGGPAVLFIALMDTICFLGAILSALCLAALVALIAGEIGVAFLSKIVPSVPAGIPVAWEYTGYLLGTVFMMGSGLALRTGGHIRLGIVLDSLKGGKRRAMETLSSVIGLIFTGFMFGSLLQFTLRTLDRGTLSPQSFTPLWIPQGLLTLGALLLFLQMFARLLACVIDVPVDNVKMRPKTLED
jgi:TRAP-type C4-dicarboxylate transport system permease small subunit